MRKFGLIILGAVLASFAFIPTPKATFKASVEKENGKTFFVVYCEVPGEFHIYSNDNDPNSGPIPTSLMFDEKKVKAVGKMIEEGELHDKFDKNFQQQVKYYEGKVVFKQEIKVMDGTSSVKGEIEYMLCDDETCFPPEIVELSASL